VVGSRWIPARGAGGAVEGANDAILRSSRADVATRSTSPRHCPGRRRSGRWAVAVAVRFAGFYVGRPACLLRVVFGVRPRPWAWWRTKVLSRWVGTAGLVPCRVSPPDVTTVVRSPCCERRCRLLGRGGRVGCRSVAVAVSGRKRGPRSGRRRVLGRSGVWGRRGVSVKCPPSLSALEPRRAHPRRTKVTLSIDSPPPGATSAVR